MPETNKEIKILDFVNLTEIDPIFFQKTYYLGPGDTGSNAYNLLLNALLISSKIGICIVSIRSKSSLAAIRVIDKCIAMETIYYPDEIRSVNNVPNLVQDSFINEKELEMAHTLIEHLSSPFEPFKYRDEYREQLIEIIQRKVEGKEKIVRPINTGTNILDLMSALKASIEAFKDSSIEKNKPNKKTKQRKVKATITTIPTVEYQIEG